MLCILMFTQVGTVFAAVIDVTLTVVPPAGDGDDWSPESRPLSISELTDQIHDRDIFLHGIRKRGVTCTF